jgi:5-methylcytosine-specific restriction enzyme subunit McrC
VGVIKVGDLTIEVLPKTDKHQLDKGEWQGILLEMLLVSLQVEAKTTTLANVSLRQHSVLDTYLHLFLGEAEQLIHRGLVKKYRTNVSNQQSLKGKLLVHKQITKNAVHAERFYVAHTVYDRDNIYNFLVKSGLECVVSVGSEPIKRKAESLLLYFPECNHRSINEKVFQTLAYDRKTEGYKRGIELARIILLNYHPDIKGGLNDILAIMFDMNYLWESFIYWSMRRSAKKNPGVSISAQRTKVFWKKSQGWSMRLKPDLEISFTDGSRFILDTKWKYQSKVTPDDLRQLYAYLHYFESHQGYLLYPDKESDHVRIESGDFWAIDADKPDARSCGLMFADLIVGSQLNREIGGHILEALSKPLMDL